MKTKLIDQDLFIIETINKSIKEIIKEKKHYTNEYDKGNLNKDNYNYVINLLNEQHEKYSNVIRLVKWGK